jgi:hypothetical protein
VVAYFAAVMSIALGRTGSYLGRGGLGWPSPGSGLNPMPRTGGLAHVLIPANQFTALWHPAWYGIASANAPCMLVGSFQFRLALTYPTINNPVCGAWQFFTGSTTVDQTAFASFNSGSSSGQHVFSSSSGFATNAGAGFSAVPFWNYDTTNPAQTPAMMAVRGLQLCLCLGRDEPLEARRVSGMVMGV